MHGGSAAILDLDPETGNAWTQLSGYCGGSGIALRTTLAIQSCLPMDLAGMTEVRIDTA